MNNNTYRKVTGTVFAVVAVMHALRLISGWEVVFNGWAIPIWFSLVGVVFAGCLAWNGLKK
ncbi:MAG: hypothetical protein A3C71_02895 [Candidatus Yanofskybacteria bacterium RIFCSPHIGHO2_02_FULL_43_15c]|uniref:Uncharacterized protein n=2 Tax=Candidatus Yanofskyibacteriota TaxID=1752733 RepID=A0A1F8ECI7_9BACT|nr:MAG: hypothetical protein A2649_00240 [Candidatus Yanofskybacteria bacterium RIFCSPHIGHO2_01_FULL_41_26]OGN12779.1 MAG: hypothetical protein A3C71_02895 [Candidatus Yanofskybacteria bacterium RIFCSPHIGHO2_02_FULL_43_15c]OGN21478.1 MAG: hypothetical protein A2915_02155 [Candidatus Yanofskybacteria bacterium RIFCSPLOWO2_01_FULL_41_34]